MIMSTSGRTDSEKIKEIQSKLHQQQQNVSKAETAYTTFVRLENHLLQHESLNHVMVKNLVDHNEDRIVCHFTKQILGVMEETEDPIAIQNTILVSLRELPTSLINKLRISLSGHHAHEKLALKRLQDKLKRLQQS
jgi:hypothetical protein